MARKKQVRARRTEIQIDSGIETHKELDTGNTVNPPFFTKKHLLIAAILLVAVLAWRFKGLLIAATVNGQPISRMELNSQLTNRFGQQVLDNIINERLILAATREQGIFVTNAELDERVASIEKKLAGQSSLADALTVQGLTAETFRRQLEIQIAIEKLYTNEATVSSKEIEDYIKSNAAYYKDATDPAALREEVNETLRQQKINEKFEPWFSQVKNGAKIQKFID